MPEAAGDQRRETRFLLGRQAPPRHHADLDLIQRGLHDLVLHESLETGDLPPRIEGKPPLAVWQDQHVARAAENAPQDWQRSPTTAVSAHFRQIAERVANQRRREIVQRRDDDAPDLARPAGTARLVQHLDHRGLRLHMQMRVIRASR